MKEEICANKSKKKLTTFNGGHKSHITCKYFRYNWDVPKLVKWFLIRYDCEELELQRQINQVISEFETKVPIFAKIRNKKFVKPMGSKAESYYKSEDDYGFDTFPSYTLNEMLLENPEYALPEDN